VDKDGSTDEIAIDETRLLPSRKAFAQGRQRHNSKEKEPRMASERTETGDRRTDGDKEKKVTFVTDVQPERRPTKKEPVTKDTNRPKGPTGDERQNDDYMKILKRRLRYYCV